MARTINEIFAEIEAAKNADVNLANLSSASSTAVWRLWAFVTAGAVWVLETLYDKFRAEVDTIVARAAAGTPGWYARRALEFRLGDTLEVLDNTIKYPDNAEGEQIITRATAKESDEGVLFLKVAKDGAEPGTLQALSNAELTQFTGYVSQIKFAGTRLQVASRDADRLEVEGEIFYDPVLNLEELKVAVSAAINAYLAAVPFDGVIYRSKIMDVIQAVAGVTDVVLGDITARSGGALYPVTRLYETQAGYIAEEDTEGQLFADTLIFTPYV